MSNKELARRTTAEVYIGGVDFSAPVRKNLISLTYTDNEDDEADDLQIRLEDREGAWLNKLLDAAIQAAAETSVGAQQSGTQYKVTAAVSLWVRSGPGTSYSQLGCLAHGALITVSAIENGWASIKYSGKDAYVSASYIQAVGSNSSSGSSSSMSSGSSSSWAVGDEVIANGKPQYTSYGEGDPGTSVIDHRGAITYLNLKDGVPYPIHVAQLGWFAESQVTKADGEEATDDSDPDTKGLSIQAAIVQENWMGDGGDKVLDCGQFELDNVIASGPPSEVNIKCTSLPYNSRIRQTKKNKAWENYSLSGIAKEMAAANGMACMYESSTDPLYERLEQITESDISFLSNLCHKAGISLKATNNILVLFDQSEYEAKDAVRTITNGDGSYLKYKLFTGASDTKYTSCRVRYTNPDTGAVISAIAYCEDYAEIKKRQESREISDSKKGIQTEKQELQQLEITAKVNSVSEAQALAEKSLRLKNKYEYGATFTLPGDADLVAGVTINLSGWGPWDNKYIVKQAKHSISSSGYTVQLTLRRVYNGDKKEAEENPPVAWAVGDTVVATGQPQHSSYGDGPPGTYVTNYRASITYLNLKDGVPYPIHVGGIGWFAQSQVQKEV